MPGFTERIVIEVEARTKGAANDLKALGTNMREADGLFGKAKAGLSGIGNTVSGLIGGPAGMAALGAATIAGAIKLADGFATAALAADNMANRTGMAVEAASRWIAVADDIGVSADEITGAAQKLVQNIGAAPEKFDALGISTTNSNDAMRQAIELLASTPEGAERAALGMQLFGKQWGSVSELATLDAQHLEAALRGVSDAQVFNEEEVARAKKYRAAMDNLSDSLKDIGTEAGGNVAPAIAEVAQALADVVTNTDKLANAIPGVEGLGSLFSALVYPLTGVTEGFGRAADSSRGFWERTTGGIQGLTTVIPGINILTNMLGDSTNATEDQAAAADEAATSTEGLAAKAKELAAEQAAAAKAADEHEKALRNLISAQLAGIDAALGEADSWDRVLTAVDAARVATDDQATSVDEVAAANRDAIGGILAYAGSADKAAEATARANGEQYDAADSAAVQIAALQRVKQKFPELAPVIDGFIAKLQQAANTDVNVPVTAEADLASADAARRGVAARVNAGGPIRVPVGIDLVGGSSRASGARSGVPQPFAAPSTTFVTVNVPPTLNPSKVVAAVGAGQSRNGGLRRG